MALHDFPPGDEPDVLPDDGFVPVAKRIDPSTLHPRFTERRFTCLTCSDTGYTWSAAGRGYRPCHGCVRGDKIHGGWWKEAMERRDNRRRDPEENRLLAPSEEGEVQF